MDQYQLNKIFMLYVNALEKFGEDLSIVISDAKLEGLLQKDVTATDLKQIVSLYDELYRILFEYPELKCALSKLERDEPEFEDLYDYEADILSDGDMVARIHSNGFYDALAQTYKLGEELKKDGYNKLKVSWERFPQKTETSVKNAVFPWEE